MAAARSQAAGKPMTGIIMLGATAAAGYAIYSGFPGLAAFWAGLLVSAWTHPPAMFSGRKDSRGYPTPAHPGEQSAMNKYRFWDDLKFKLVLPNRDWLPGLKPSLSFLVALWAGTAAWFIPVNNDYTGTWGPWVNAAAAFIAVVQTAASRRRHQVPDDENPGARIDTLIAMARDNTGRLIGLTIGGIVTGGIIGTAATVFIPLATDAAGVPTIAEPIIWLLALTGGILALLAKPWINAALEHWLIVVAAREEWSSRWEMLKQDPAPRLIDRQEVGPATIDTFEAPGSSGAMAYWTMGPKIGPTLGTGAKFAIADTPNLDSNNQPVPGTRHPLRFDIIRWPSDQIPDVTDPDTPKDVVLQLARCSLIWMAESTSCARPIIDDVHLLTVQAPSAEDEGGDAAPDDDNAEQPAAANGPTSGSAWAVTWHLPDGPPASYIRSQGRGELMGAFNAEVLVDHNAQNGMGCMYVGALTDPSTEWDPQVGMTAKEMQRLSDEDTWNGRWAEVMKQDTNPPVMQSETFNTARLKNGVTLNHIAFVTRQGMTPNEFFLLEPKLPTVLNAAPFVAVTGYPGGGRRPGERHPQAFSVYWAAESTPSKPDDLAPVPRSEAPKWVLAGRVNEAFKIARLADRPEIVAATCLTRPESRHHIWKIDLRLYGGVTLAEVRGAAQKIKQHWASEWLRVASAPDGCTIIAGARPSRVKLADPKHEQYLAALDWDQAFLDSGVSGIGGMMPVLKNVGHMPRNQQVSILDFELPAGLSFTDFVSARPKLESNSGNSFVEPRRIKDKANQIQLLACEVNPMPEKAGYDWDHIKESAYIPFATGVDGEPVEYNFRVDPHLLVAGASGGGKSVLLQSLAFGALARGYELFVADPTKGGADFRFTEPYARGFTVDAFEAAAMMKGIYAEVVRRKNANSEHGVGNYRDLPEDIRPSHIVILLDEFTSLMGQDPVPAASDDPEMDTEREMIIAMNQAKLEVGIYAGKVAREARSAGVTLFLATQKLSAKMLDTIPGAGDLKVNLSRLLLGKATYGDKQSALRAPQDAPDLGDAIPAGRGLFETTAGAAMAIQAWYDVSEQAILREKIAEMISPLPEHRKLDLSPFMAKLPTAEEPAPETPRPKADAVVDLGEIELDIEDLELDWSDLEDDASQNADDDGTADEPSTIEEPAETPLAAQPEQTPPVDTAVFLSVDGTIAPHGTTERGLITVTSSGQSEVHCNPQILQRLSDLPVTLAWLTDWEDDAAAAFGHLLSTTMDVLTSDTEDSGWWKIDAALAWLHDHPTITNVIWIDAELGSEDCILGVPYRDIATDAFAAAGIDAQLVSTHPQTGLTHDELDRIERLLETASEAEPETDMPEPANVVEEPNWSAFEDQFSRDGSADEAEAVYDDTSDDDDDPFSEPKKKPVFEEDEDPFAEPVPVRARIDDDDDPFA